MQDGYRTVKLIQLQSICATQELSSHFHNYNIYLPDSIAAELGELRLVDVDQPGVLLVS